MEERLTGHNFFRVHLSHLININEVTRYIKGSGGIVVMSDGKELKDGQKQKNRTIAASEGLTGLPAKKYLPAILI